MDSQRQRIRTIAARWFITEPAYFMLYCTHHLEENPNMLCELRAGEGRLEFNPSLLATLRDEELEERMRIEFIRVFLKHPYERRPEGVLRHTLYEASDMVLDGNYVFTYSQLTQPKAYKLPQSQSYEWYLSHIPMSKSSQPEKGQGGQEPESTGTANSQDHQHDSSNQAQGGGGTGGDNGQEEKSDGKDKGKQSGGSPHGDPEPAEASEQTEQHPISREQRYASAAGLWDEDQGWQTQINDVISNVKDWGSIPGNVQELIKASTRARIDYRQALRGFRTSIISTRRHLTRMKPSRRYGFHQMGSTYAFSTSLLIAIDTSGSVSSQMLANFFSVVVKFFRYGIEHIDVIQFDAQVYEPPLTLRQAKQGMVFQTYGRGGTDFQIVFDYLAQHRHYDGLLILTDGYALEPTMARGIGTRVLWVCESAEAYQEHHHWMEHSGRCCYLNLK